MCFRHLSEKCNSSRISSPDMIKNRLELCINQSQIYSAALEMRKNSHNLHFHCVCVCVYMIIHPNCFPTLIRQWNVSAITWKCDLHWISHCHHIYKYRSCLFMLLPKPNTHNRIETEMWKSRLRTVFEIFQMRIFHFGVMSVFQLNDIIHLMALNLDWSWLPLPGVYGHY